MEAEWLDAVAGQGFEGMGGKDTTIPMLLISQQLSQAVANEQVKVGHFYNSITGRDYGTKLNIVVCHFEKAWVEWRPNQGGFVGRWRPGEIEVTGDTYSGMKHGENDVQETYMYLCVLPDFIEDGYVMFSSTRGNLKYLKGWNTSMMYLRLPSGKPAPLFSAIWEVELNKDTNKKGNTFYSCNRSGKSSFVFKSWVDKEMFTNYIEPARKDAAAITSRVKAAPQVEAF